VQHDGSGWRCLVADALGSFFGSFLGRDSQTLFFQQLRRRRFLSSRRKRNWRFAASPIEEFVPPLNAWLHELSAGTTPEPQAFHHAHYLLKPLRHRG
jgi:hypothetical protein